jgi:spore coat polysaccharide biosynthesis protein SpsF (cytidylyltransferase family)
MTVDSLVFVSVRFSSSRLPGKCMLLVNDVPLIDHLINRLHTAGLSTIVCTSIDESDNVIVEYCIENGINYFRGALSNKIERWAKCAETIDTRYIHIIGADNPFIDTDEIKKSLMLAQTSKYDFINTSKRSDSGFGSVGISITKDFLQILNDRTHTLRSDDLDVIPWGLLIKEGDAVSEMEDNILLTDEECYFRLTLDYEEDFLMLSHLISKFGATESRENIERYLLDNPEVARINFFRNADFVKNQKEKLNTNFN